jgi:hypothetical protein
MSIFLKKWLGPRKLQREIEKTRVVAHLDFEEPFTVMKPSQSALEDGEFRRAQTTQTPVSR